MKPRMQFLVKPVNSAQEILLVLQSYLIYFVLAKVPANISLSFKERIGDKLFSSEEAIISILLMSGKFDLFSNIFLPGKREKSTSLRVCPVDPGTLRKG